MLVSVSPADQSVLASIVDAMRDPEKAKQFLVDLRSELDNVQKAKDELQARHVSAQADMEKWEVSIAAAKALKAESENISEKAKSLLAEAVAKADKAQADNDRVLAQVAEERAELDSRAKNLTSREETVARSETEAQRRLEAIESRAMEVKMLTEVTQALKDEYETKLSKLKALV